MKNKLFRDPVHGYISIREDICKDFIDTPIFQRLKHIEQTSMRCLYPAARHDRFIHSIGTYFLAERVWKYIEQQISTKVQNEKSIKLAFLLAALLHDCAHSPFSHTGEDIAKEHLFADAKKDLIRLFKSTSFEKDLSKAKPAMHEIASAFIAVKNFGKLLDQHYGVRNEDLARMITGVKYLPENNSMTEVIKVKNCLIELLNGQVIDVDKCDYLARDTWASGVDNTSVDFERLFSGIHLNIEDSVGVISLKHQAISSIINASYARDFLYLWIISHHKVQYWQFVLTQTLKQLAIELAKKAKISIEESTKKIFSYKCLLRKNLLLDETLYMPTDGDMIYLMKKYCSKYPLWSDFINREASYSPVWKTYVEFCTMFKNDIAECKFNELREKFSDENHIFSDNELWIKIARAFQGKAKKEYEYRDKCMSFIIAVNPKVTIKNLDNFSFVMSANQPSYFQYTAMGLSQKESTAPFFYLYTKKEETHNIIDELVNLLHKTVDELLRNDSDANT